MARNATPLETALQRSKMEEAVALLNVRPKASLLKGRVIIPVKYKIKTVTVEIGRFLTFAENVEPVHVQRNDLYPKSAESPVLQVGDG